MVVAVVVGILFGLVGFVPYAIVTKRARAMASGGAMGYLKWLLLTFFISFAVLVVAMVVCAKVAHDVALPFALAEILTFVVVIIVFGLFGRGEKNKEE